MRLRHIPGSEQEIEASPYVVQNPEEKKGRWNEVFGNERPIEIEVGMGKGRFIMELASLHPDINYVGIERYPSVLLRGLQKRAEMELNNIVFMCVDAKNLSEIFNQGEVQKIYLNFSDPWPKDRHTKRRLTSEEFMEVYDKILKPDGVVEFKTDNKGLFEYSLEAIPGDVWEIKESTFDLHHSEMGEGNVMTEYEEKFSLKGNPIFKLIAGRK
ncbi:tRNA (guanosine(46)-N7)-methyltransferase TrmB [Lacrimispora algidixylanolytica]|uniref:tRNA (guanine-N(7)-)-methyltransferase n=1 Tax=Lacrimispora algidixylanolytica TaxID=94868 RepID=A0A419TCY8_9FIRM|nr:tRNA (guanosine(46)-N7)-methyltransferase TrmB [Lacrimispora algidixylanolytica]RKD35307.1 tRNA (guanosine(46)-N7)-methyltransferase TrmB [Lacrimispora algidixylanolytica]